MRYLVMLFLLTLTCLAQEKDAFTTDGMYNGRLWMKLNDNERLMYATGMRDGIISVIANLPNARAAQNEALPKGFFIDEIKKEIDNFYKDAENVNIPLMLAFTLVNVKLKGETPHEELERRVIALRKSYN